MKKIILCLMAVSFLVNCNEAETEKMSDNSGKSNQVEADKEVSVVDSKPKDTVEKIVTQIEAPIAPNIPSYQLPGGALGEDYSKELVATIQNPINNFDYNLFLMDGEWLVLQMTGVVTDVIELLYEVPNVNVNNTTVYTLSFANLSRLTAQGEVFADEFIIEYETIEMNNGVENGFENEYKGLVILDTQNEMVVANLFTTERRISYQAPKDMPADAHGKSYDGSTFEICSKESKFEVQDASFTLTDYVYDSENMECEPFLHSSGRYIFNDEVGGFELSLKLD